MAKTGKEKTAETTVAHIIPDGATYITFVGSDVVGHYHGPHAHCAEKGVTVPVPTRQIARDLIQGHPAGVFREATDGEIAGAQSKGVPIAKAPAEPPETKMISAAERRNFRVSRRRAAMKEGTKT